MDKATADDTAKLTSRPNVSEERRGPEGSAYWSWRSVFTWTRPTSTTHGAESERALLEMHGGLPLSSDPTRVQSKLVFLAPGETEDHRSSITATGNQRFINTLIVDEKDVTESARGRKNVVICHGFGAGLGFFYRNLGALGRMIPDSRIFAIDLLGMGRSGRPPFPKFQLNVTQDAKQVRGEQAPRRGFAKTARQGGRLFPRFA